MLPAQPLLANCKFAGIWRCILPTCLPKNEIVAEIVPCVLAYVPTSPRLSVRRMKLPSLRRARLSSQLCDIIRLESIKTAHLDVEATHDPLMHAADLSAEPIPGLQFDQTLDWCHRTAEGILRAARRVKVCASFEQRAASGWGCGCETMKCRLRES